MAVRILHIVGRMDRAGAETMIMNLYREIDRARYQFDFIYFTNDRCDFDDEIEAMGGRIIRVKGNNPLQRFWSLLRVFHMREWSIAQSHMLFSIGLNLLAAKLAGVPVRIAHAHSTSDRNASSTIGRLYQRVMRWLMCWVPTHYVACGVAAAHYLFPGQSNVNILPNAIDINHFCNAKGNALRKQLRIPADCLVILQVGRLIPVKNHRWSLQVATILRRLGIKFRMLFVGAGPDRRNLHQMVEMETLQKHVQFLGLREDIAEIMAASDVMLMPSLYEGFPVVLVESQAAGLPAVISNTISKEVDLGLGLVDFAGLDEPVEQWTKRILESQTRSRISATQRRQLLEEIGYSTSASVKKMTAIYSSSH